ncbi:MAG: RNA polymerase sigma-70 factor [Sediminicola sp.]|tara:strand:- start:5060 stop:5656 length:597 start_codon:yes stop_codon:yes gene_type:complete
MEEKFLVEGLIQGNEKAYRYLYDKFYENLVVYCSNLTNNQAMAEDIVQNVLVKLWTNRSGLTIHSSVKSYLYRSVFNAFATEYKKGKKMEESLIRLKGELLERQIELDEGILDEKIKILEKAIGELPKKCRTIFLLSKKQGYKYKEIALLMNISEKAVEKHISRAIHRLKKSCSFHLVLFFSFLFRSDPFSKGRGIRK